MRLGVETLDPIVIEEFKKFDTTSLSDALDRLGITGGLLGINPVVAGVAICGPAFTVHYVPCGPEKGTVGDFLDDVEPGQVVVLDNAGRTYCTVWGDLMSLSASQRGIAGTVIDGVCRDVPGIRKLNYPIFTKGVFMVTGKDRVQCDGVNIPISIAGVQVKPGDLVIGDDTGVLVIPYEKAEQVLEAAREIAVKEGLIEQEVRNGATLREARAKVGYHSLQTKQ
ncbi:MAG TPA: RraA family protein [Desulfosporosinus sp.]|nr:RraA family protein [Desulfosporosinus sp.]